MVVDLQDIGARFYTYMTTMAYVMEEAAKRNIRVVVLDRPTRSTATRSRGRCSKGESASSATSGDAHAARDDARRAGAAVQRREPRSGRTWWWSSCGTGRRDDWFDETGLPWVNPSPNMRNLLQATLYPGVASFEGTNISVGRGTDTPFEQVGAPWIDGVQLAEALNARNLRGHPLLPRAVHAGGEQVREGGVPGGVHGDHRPRGAAARARGPRDRVGAPAPVRPAFPDRPGRAALRREGGAGAHQGRRRPGVHRDGLGRRRSAGAAIYRSPLAPSGFAILSEMAA
jgi:hypothetical protein